MGGVLEHFNVLNQERRKQRESRQGMFHNMGTLGAYLTHFGRATTDSFVSWFHSCGQRAAFGAILKPRRLQWSVYSDG